MSAYFRWSTATLTVALTGILLTGCMTFQTNDATLYPSFPPPEIKARSQKVELHIEATYQVVGFAATNDMRQSVVDNVTGWAEDALEQTGVFRVHPDSKTADYRLVIRVRDDANPNIGMAMLTGLTLYLIPSSATDSYTTDVELIDEAGNQIGTKRYKHQLKLVQQIFLVFGLPFATLNSVSKEMWQEVLQDVAVWSASLVAGEG